MNFRHGYWATIDHVRTWRLFDGPVRTEIVRDGKLTPYTTAAIAIEYNLLSSLPWKGGFDRFRTIADIVNEIVDDCSDDASLGEKLLAAQAIVVGLRERFSLKKGPYSAATKLLWFARPSRWTMFDRHAYNALFRDSSGRANDVPRFYRQLEDAGFARACDKIKSIADKYQVTLVPERIIDKLLMLRGSAAIVRENRFGEVTRADCGQFVKTNVDKALHGAANEVEFALADWCGPAVLAATRISRNEA